MTWAFAGHRPGAEDADAHKEALKVICREWGSCGYVEGARTGRCFGRGVRMDQSSPHESRRVMDDEAISRLWADDVIGSLREMTPEQAARRVGQEFEFGAPIGLGRWRSYPALLILGWLMGFVAATGMLSLGLDSNLGVSKPLVLGCLAVLLLVCFFMIVFGTKRRMLQGWLARYPYGYVQMLASDPGPRAVRWASVTEVTVTYRTTTIYTGTGATVSNAFVGSFAARPFIGRLAPEVRGQWEDWKLMRDSLRAAGTRLVTAMIEAYESGRVVAFGSMRIDQHGVASPRLVGTGWSHGRTSARSACGMSGWAAAAVSSGRST
jgi:hypothetical protein